MRKGLVAVRPPLRVLKVALPAPPSCGQRWLATQPFSLHDTADKLAAATVEQRVLAVDVQPSDGAHSFSTARVPDLPTAYALQLEVAKRVASSGPGRQVVGYKVGASNDAAQKRMGLNEPFYGPLYGCNVTRNPQAVGSRNAALPAASLWSLRGAECEYAFEVGRDVLPRPDGSPWGAASILSHVWFIYPAIELVSSRLVLPTPPSPVSGAAPAGAAGPAPLTDIPTACKVADQALQGHTILAPAHYMTPEQWTRFVAASSGSSSSSSSGSGGSSASAHPHRPLFADTSVCGVRLSVDGALKAEGTGAAVMGSGPGGGPAASLAWLANKLISQGQHLKAGHVVITGTLCMPALVPLAVPQAVPGAAVNRGASSSPYTRPPTLPAPIRIEGEFSGFGRVEVELC